MAGILVTHRHQAVIILILSALLGMALLSAGCTRIPLGSETSVTTPAGATSDLAAVSSMNSNNNPGILKNPDGSGSWVSTLPDAKGCNTSDNNQSTCPLPTTPEARKTAVGTQIPDPAAAYCINMNNSLEIRKNAEGSEYGFCILADGTVCDLWDYYQGVCPLLTTPVAEARNPDAGTLGSDPSAVYCTNMNNRLEIRQNPDGSEYGVCILADDTECDVIAYYEGTCPNAPAPEEIPVDETMVNPYEALCRAKNFPYEIRVNPDGSERGVCIFPDGKECDVWDYYVGDCSEETALEEPSLEEP
jgi:putative hemolysin